jgi:REP-associated tyrosine transposase
LKSYYQRNLPHWHPPGVPVFVTCRLAGSLPKSAVEGLKHTQALIEREIALGENSIETLAELKVRHYKKLFAKLDSILDKAATGPRWLGDPEIASLVEDAILRRGAELL